MNKIEKIVYDAVKSNPKIKLALRNIYQDFFDLLPDRPNWSAFPIIVKEGYFFGFHDVSPFSEDEKFLLSNRLEIPETPLLMPVKGDRLTVGYWINNFKHFIPVKKTLSWNYHKGCRLQWLGRSNTEFIFNDYIDNRICSVIYSISNKEFHKIDYPIDVVSHDGRYATSFSYERLNKYMPGYGYIYKDKPFFEDKDSSKTGIFIVDLKKNTQTLIVSLKQLVGIDHEKTMDGANHYVTHSEFSPDDERIAFLHRWTFNDTNKRYTRLITCKLDGSDIQVSKTSGMVSHYVWDSKHGILAYCRVDGKDGHYIFTDYKLNNVYLATSLLNSDGHQSFIPQKDMFITDTYPDKHRHAMLYIVNILNGKVKKIADLKSPKKFQSRVAEKHWACDLHPRVSPKGTYVCFDSVHTGHRALCFMKIKR